MPVVLEDDHIKINEIVQIFDDVNDINLNTKLQAIQGTNISINSSGVISSIIPVASTSVSGGIIVGNNLTISSGVLSGLTPPNLAPYILVTDSYTKLEVDSRDNNTSNYILELLEVIPYETLSVPLKDLIVEEDVLSLERLYPPLRDVVSFNHLVQNEEYGNGEYVISSSTSWSVSPSFQIFRNGVTGTFGFHNYLGGTYRDNKTDKIVNGYNGDWLKIKLPVSIKLTRIVIKARGGGFLNRAPANFKIYGSNDETNWEEIIHITNATYSLQNTFYEILLSIPLYYNNYGLVVNKLFNNLEGVSNVLNFENLFIHGIEIIGTEDITYQIPNEGYLNYTLDGWKVSDVIPYETLSVPLKDADAIGNIIPPITTEPIIDIDDDYKYIAFTNTGANQTSYNITFPVNTLCDILLIGGGAGGGGSTRNSRGSGGGGAGEYEINQGIILLDGTTLTLNIGNGGAGGGPGVNGILGQPTTVSGGGLSFEALGGGGGARGAGGVNTSGISGACGGGSTLGGVAGLGTIGGSGGLGGANYFGGGGGGMSATNGNGKNAISSGGGIGGDGVIMNITGTNIQVCGGGGGGGYTETYSGLPPGGGGIGSFGGGNGGATGSFTLGVAYAGINASSYGSGGGGAAPGSSVSAAVSGGNGGSGIVIIRYKYTKPIIIQVPNEGYLNYKTTGWEISNIVGDTNLLIHDTSNYIKDTSNVISTRITNLPQPNLTGYRLISDSYTQAQVDTKDTATSNVISTRINNLPQPD